MILQLITRGSVTMAKMTNTIQIRMTMDNIYMKQTKSDIVVTKFGTLVHSLKDYRLNEIIGVHAASEDKYNAEIEFKYIHNFK